MTVFLISLFLFLAAGLASYALMLTEMKSLGRRVGAWGAVSAAVFGCIPAVRAIAGTVLPPLIRPWPIFMGSFCVKLDMLSGFFLLIILFVVACTAIYGLEYERDNNTPGIKRMSWLFFNLLGASMAMVCAAGNALLFLLAWEVMALSSFFLVAFDHEKAAVRRAAWIYMTATYLGTACLLPMFLLLGSGAGLDFSLLGMHLRPLVADVCFVLALIGFGTKAGIMPFHVWLPDAHPAAPTHVSALMSGVMIKTGIYGLLRCMTFLGLPHLWWGEVLLVMGAVSGVLGVLFALAQHDLKRLLAYHSVENIGIILMGLGIGCIGLSAGAPVTAVLGFAGALLHVVNHALFKSLLFMGAGGVYRAAHTREMNLLGGVMKKMPLTGATFLIGAAAISGLPPLNGFVSEFLLYAASFFGIAGQKASAAVPLAAAVAALALIGGLAAACFAKAFGVVFLGAPRSLKHTASGESGPLMLGPMLAIAMLCCAIGLFGPFAANKAVDVTVSLFGLHRPPQFASVGTMLFKACVASWMAVLAIGALYFTRNFLLRKRSVSAAPTWDCGYTAATSRMQYTASSFAQPIIDLFSKVLKTQKRGGPLAQYFPADATFSSDTPDAGNERLYRPVFASVTAILSRFGVLQRGRIQMYLLYIVIALSVLLIWRLQ